MNGITVQITYPDGRTEQRVLPQGRHEVGRDIGAIALFDPDVSARHVALDVHPNGALVAVDLGSTNGTFDDGGQRLTGPYPLPPGASVRLGRSALTHVPGGAEKGGTRAMPQVPAVLPSQPPVAAQVAAAPHLVEYAPSTPTFVGAGRTFRYQSTSGVARSVGKGLETRVHGSAAPGQSYAHVSSTTVVHDDLYLVDKAGQEQSYQLAHFDVAALPGHQLTVVWAVQEGEQRGPYLVVGNHTTGRLFFNDKALKEIFTPWYIRGGVLYLNLSLLLTIVLIPVPIVSIFLGAAKRDAGVAKFKTEFALIPPSGVPGTPLRAPAWQAAGGGGLPLWVLFLCPLALPLVLQNPKYTKVQKVRITVATVGLVFLLAAVLMH